MHAATIISTAGHKYFSVKHQFTIVTTAQTGSIEYKTNTLILFLIFEIFSLTRYTLIQQKTLKKIVSITLLLAFLLHTVGYYILLWGMQYQAHHEMKLRLDADNYADNETIVIKIPLTLPYDVFGKEYERSQGSFEYQGEYFKLVKQRLENDTLYTICIRDQKEKRIHTTLTGFIKLFNDVPAVSKKILAFFAKDYNASHTIIMDHWQSHTLMALPKAAITLRNTSLPVRTPPPDLSL